MARSRHSSFKNYKMILKADIEKQLKRIYANTKTITDNLDDSILKNLGGFMFLGNYCKYYSKSIDTHLDKLLKFIDCYEINEEMHQSMAGGYPSIQLILYYLSENNLAQIDIETINSIDEISIIATELQLSINNFDLLYGATGLLHQLNLSKTARINSDLLVNFFVSILYKRKVNQNQIGIVWEDYYYRTRENDFGVNLGLAHGIMGILKLLLSLYDTTANTTKETIRNMAIGICDFMFTIASKELILKKENAIFGGYFIPNNLKRDSNSRLGWCYGDLSIGYILYQAGKTFKNQKVIDFALEILEYTTKRRTLDETMVYDAGICHGSAGVAHIYNRIWHYTKLPIFKDATDFWIGRTLDFAIHDDGVAGYKKYNPIQKNYENDFGLLEGSSGIGLVLLSYITGDFSWDYCLMLNNLSDDGTY